MVWEQGFEDVKFLEGNLKIKHRVNSVKTAVHERFPMICGS